jgi:tetratricopeptide (TPR) repeat protein
VSQKNFAGQIFVRERMTSLWQGGLIVVLVFIGYFPALCGGFVWDDDSWTTNLSALFQDTSGLRLIWFHPAALQQYYPLTGTTFWLDYQLWNFWTTPYHVENVLLHTLAALLFWRLLLQLQLPGAWLASAIFALHPVMVESVAWITERKNVLSLVFYLGALLAYARYAQWATRTEEIVAVPDSSRDARHSQFFYGLALVLFLGALLAKTATFSLPAVVLLISWWKCGQIRWRADVLPTVRFFVVALGLCAATFWLERYRVGAQGLDFALTFPQRCVIAGHAFWFYLGKLFWPASLCFVYPRWQPNPVSLWEWLYPVTAIITLLILWLARRRIGRGPVSALFFYMGTLFPVLGFINAYGMRYSFVWDHWVYLSSLGIIALVAALVMRVAESLRKPAVAYGFAAIILPVLTLLTWRQAGIYTDVETLWRKTLDGNPDCSLAHNNLGNLLYTQGNVQEAMEYYRKAIQTKPDYYEALHNLALAFANEGRFDEAIENYRKAIQFYPNFPDALNGLGVALVHKNQTDEAISQYREAIRLKPDYADAHYNLALALLDKNQTDEAMNQFKEAARLNPDYRPACINLGNIIDLNDQAWELAISPDAGIRDGARAVKLAEDACQQTHYQQTIMVGTLAAAYAEAGRFDEAITTGQKACALASELGQTNLLKRNQELITLYQAHRAYHEPASNSEGSPSY